MCSSAETKFSISLFSNTTYMAVKQNPPASRKATLLLALCTVLALSFSACKKEDNPVMQPQTIAEQINGNANFTLLKAALTQAGIDLSAAGPYTLLAPTNAAFQAFGLTNETVIKLAPADLVRSVLAYHVIGSKVETSAIPAIPNTAIPTSLSSTVVFVTKGVSTSSTSTTTISVNGARLIPGSTDVQASNGVIHTIDRILLPPLYGNIPNTINQIPQIYALLAPTAGISFRLLQQAVTRAGIGGALTAAGPLTVFAPTDNAFRAAGFDSVAIANAPVATLASVLSYHVLNNTRAYTPTLTNGSSLSTLQGGTITANVSTTAVTVTGRGNGTNASTIIGPDVTATNGVIHIIDRLLTP